MGTFPHCLWKTLWKMCITWCYVSHPTGFPHPSPGNFSEKRLYFSPFSCRLGFIKDCRPCGAHKEVKNMKVARFVLKIVALSLGAAAAVCAIIAYWDKLAQLGSCAKTKIQRTACASEYDDYEE